MASLLDFERDAKGAYGLPLPKQNNNKFFKTAAAALVAAYALGTAVPRIDMRPLAAEFQPRNTGRSFDKPDCKNIRDVFSTNGAWRVAMSFLPKDVAPRRASDTQLKQCHIAPPQV